MRRCRGGGSHDPEITKDPDVQDQSCGLNEVWTPEGVKHVWMCCHRLSCKNCNSIISQTVRCPDNDTVALQDRRWR